MKRSFQDAQVMISALLSFLAGASVSVAGLHLLVGIRMTRDWRHFLVAATALALGGYVLVTGALYDASTVAGYARLAQLHGALVILALGLIWWFVAEHTGVRPLWLLGAVTVVLAAALVANFMSEAGIFYTRIIDLESARLPWGETVTLPVVTDNPHDWLFTVAWIGPLPYAAYALRHQYLHGNRRNAKVLAVASLAAIVPALIDTFLQGTGPMVFPFSDVGLCAFVISLSVGLTDAVVELGRTRRSLELTQHRARALVEGAPDGIAIVDPRTRAAIEVNPAGREMFALDADMLPADVFSLCPEVQPNGQRSEDVGQRWLHAACRGKSDTGLWQMLRRDGSTFPAEVRLGPILGEDGEALVRVSILDVSERRAAEQRERELTRQLHETQKLETLGTLAGGIAHDFNNLLTPMMGHAELAAESLRRGLPIEHNLEALHSSALRARDLVQQILAFSRRPEGGPASCDLAEVTRRTLRLLQASLPVNVTVELQIDVDAALVPLDQTRIQQLVLNLATNAQQAMPEGGTLRLAVQRRQDPQGTRFALTVTDTGEGMEPGVRDRVFDPFFTTKPLGQGTGLGLSVVHGIVTGAGGVIEVESRHGEGSTFRVVLPEDKDANVAGSAS